ncbi:MAG TPA: recombinase family protein [Noviherbaspirillum sp.]|nr:recombinase family protein [Noviherbaspirillum sp.]
MRLPGPFQLGLRACPHYKGFAVFTGNCAKAVLGTLQFKDCTIAVPASSARCHAAPYSQLLEAWSACRFEAVIVEEFSRFSRDAVDQAILMRKVEKNRRVRMLTTDGIDSAQPDWQLRLGLQGVMAQQEIRKIKARVPRGMEGQLERGFISEGRAYKGDG